MPLAFPQNQLGVIDTHHKTTRLPPKDFLWRMSLAFLTKSAWRHWHSSQNRPRMFFFVTDVIGTQNLFSFTSMELTGTNLRRASLGLITKSILETTPPGAPVRDPVNGAQYMSKVRCRALTSVTKSILQSYSSETLGLSAGGGWCRRASSNMLLLKFKSTSKHWDQTKARHKENLRSSVPNSPLRKTWTYVIRKRWHWMPDYFFLGALRSNRNKSWITTSIMVNSLFWSAGTPRAGETSCLDLFLVGRTWDIMG